MLGWLCPQAGDCYAFGVVLWELVTGELPIRARMRCAVSVCVTTGSSCWHAGGLIQHDLGSTHHALAPAEHVHGC